MNQLGLTLTQVTEAAALAAYQWLGRGCKNAADQAAVSAMRKQLNASEIEARIAIGEGEIDDAPMLYIGEELGRGGAIIDIAVDPIEGTRMTAMGQANALAVLAATERGALLQAPDMYMEKLVTRPQASSATINLSQPLEENLISIARALNKPLSQLAVATLAKPRHEKLIAQLHSLGVKVYAFPDGDVAASLLVCLPDNDIDVMVCTGGAPEGVISAAVVKALGGVMQARLLTRDHVKGATPENIRLANKEHQRCLQMGTAPNRILTLDDMVKTDNIIFCATGITKGDVVNGVQKYAQHLTTETLLVQGETKTIRMISSTHQADTANELITLKV